MVHSTIVIIQQICNLGKVLLASRSGRVEKSIEGHKGAVLGIKWAHDGTALLTCMLLYVIYIKC